MLTKTQMSQIVFRIKRKLDEDAVDSLVLSAYAKSLGSKNVSGFMSGMTIGSENLNPIKIKFQRVGTFRNEDISDKRTSGSIVHDIYKDALRKRPRLEDDSAHIYDEKPKIVDLEQTAYKLRNSGYGSFKTDKTDYESISNSELKGERVYNPAERAMNSGLHIARQSGVFSGVFEAISLGINVNYMFEFKTEELTGCPRYSALMLACIWNDLRTAGRLLDLGGNPLLADPISGRTSLDISRAAGLAMMTQLLENEAKDGANDAYDVFMSGSLDPMSSEFRYYYHSLVNGQTYESDDYLALNYGIDDEEEVVVGNDDDDDDEKDNIDYPEEEDDDDDVMGDERKEYENFAYDDADNASDA